MTTTTTTRAKPRRARNHRPRRRPHDKPLPLQFAAYRLAGRHVAWLGHEGRQLGVSPAEFLRRLLDTEMAKQHRRHP